MRPTKYLLSLALTSLLTACGPTPEWRAGSPVSVVVDPDLPISTDVARQAVADRLSQFGIPVGAGTRSIRVSFGADAPGCSTRVPGAVVAAYTADRIWVCPGITEATAKTPRGPYLVVSHEMGHMLGLVGHLPAGQGNLMSPILDDYKGASGFGPADLAAICAAGHVDSPAC
jgi:hypothetical protein